MATTTATHAPLVLTPRGQVVVAVLRWAGAVALVGVLAAGLWLAVAAVLAPGASAGDGRAASAGAAGLERVVDADGVEAVEVVVRPGDTLWALAREHAPDRDPRGVVHDVIVLNELAGPTVQQGQRLLVPTR